MGVMKRLAIRRMEAASTDPHPRGGAQRLSTSTGVLRGFVLNACRRQRPGHIVQYNRR
jgi:hypothetical protein